MNTTWSRRAIKLLFLVFGLSVSETEDLHGIQDVIPFEGSGSCFIGRGREQADKPTGTPPCIEEVTFSFLFRQTEAIQAYPVDSVGCNAFPRLHCCCFHNLQYKTSSAAQQSCSSPVQSGSKALFIRQELASTNHILPYRQDKYYLL